MTKTGRANRPPMGVPTAVSAQNKILYLEFLQTFDNADWSGIEGADKVFFAADANVQASHPINTAPGYYSGVVKPIAEALQGCQRQNYIVLAGEYLGTEWVTSTGYFYGHFAKPLFGIPASGKQAFLRFGEFHRMEQGKVVESQVFLGFAELIIALGKWPLDTSKGYEGVVPGPATQDGVQATIGDPKASRASADLVEGMLKLLATEDEQWRPFWDERMVWYGPGGLGSYSTVEAFSEFQRPFEETFDGWGDGKEVGIEGVGANCKAGDGDYAFLSGWPVITGVHTGYFLGLKATGKRVFMRDCDWWRCEDGKILENWCMLDIPHVLMQLGYDVFSEVAKVGEST